MLLRRTGLLSASRDQTEKTQNCERGQTGVEQRIAALAFLAKTTRLLQGGCGVVI